MKRSKTRSGLSVAVLAAFVITLVVVPAALAGKGGNVGKPSGGTSTIRLVPDSVPHWGQQVTFSVSTTATDRPFVGLSCYQSGVRVYSMSAGFFVGYPFTTTYILSSSYWTGGAADCVATGYYFTSNGRERSFGTLKFTVYA